jgi:glycosyltransferase involved in cell wall biosynthesis
MKILHISDSDLRGGGCIAAFEIHKTLLKRGIDSKMLVQKKFSSCDNVITLKSTFENVLRDFKIAINRRVARLLKTEDKGVLSLGMFSSSIIKKIEDINPDIVHLHWINNEMISIKKISEIKQKIIWTTHDMWPFCGAEHYSDTSRFVYGYDKLNRPDYERGFDINLYIWKKKRRLLKKKDITFVCPSEWIYLELKKSLLFKEKNAFKIPHIINSEDWKPFDKTSARNFLSLPLDKNVILFGSERGKGHERKGYSIIHNILKNYNFSKKVILIVFGGNKEEKELINDSVEIRYFGHLYDKISLRMLYSAADLSVIPSLKETFGLICAESLSCGLPCVAFENTGPADIIIHKKTGYLSKYNDLDDFLNGINWLLGLDKIKTEELSILSREHILKNFNSQIVSDKYISVYKQLWDFD